MVEIFDMQVYVSLIIQVLNNTDTILSINFA